MNFDHFFTFTIAHRGRQYFRQNRVSGLTEKNHIYTAWVEGSDDYQVTIDFTDEAHPEMECDCPYAANGIPCKHMAAVMFAIEERLNAEKKPEVKQPKKSEREIAAQKASAARTALQDEKRVFPFGQDPALLWEIGASDLADYRFFDLARITRERIITASQLKKAQMEADSGLVKLTSLWTGYDANYDARNMIGVVKGNATYGSQHPTVTIVFNRLQILHKECNVPSCSGSPGSHFLYHSYSSYRPVERQPLCTHELALLLLADKKLKESNPGDFTDRQAQKILDRFRERRAVRESGDNEEIAQTPISFEPRLTMGTAGLQVSFRIGTDKLYVIKNLTDMVDCIESKGVLSLGTKQKLDTALHPVGSATGKYYTFIRDVVRGEQSRSRYSEKLIAKNDIYELIRDNIPLYGKRLDDFFEAAKGTSLELNDRFAADMKRRITFREADPKASLTIAKEMDEGNFIGIHVEGSVPRFLEGENYVYTLDERALNRVSEAARSRLAPLTDMADYAHQVHFSIGRKNLSEFYYRVYPILQECAEISQPDIREIEEWLPPEAEFEFYLDAVDRNVTCKPLVIYGTESYALQDWNSDRVEKSDLRDAQLEQEVLTVVSKFFPGNQPEQGLLDCQNNPDLIYQLLEQGLHELLEYGQVHTSDSFRRLRIRKSANVSIGVSMTSNLLNLEIMSTELSQEELLEILYHYQNKKKYYRLKSGDFLKLDQDNLMELTAMLETMHISPKEFVQGKMQLPVYRALYLNKMLEENDSLYADRDSRFRRLVKEFKTVHDSDFEVPEQLKKTMRNYQTYGHKWLRTLEHGGFGGILADDMGLGKTLQVISVLLSSKQTPAEDDCKTSLVVCPASLVYNWAEEFSRFAPELSIQIITGVQEERAEKIRDYQDYDVLITSYDLLKRDIAEYEGLEFHYQIIDEAQYIKNHGTAAAKAVKVIRSHTRYALTGTPIENRLSELWSIFDYLMPGLLYGYDVFKRDFELPIVKYQDEDAMRQLKRMVTPFILRRLKNDVLRDLPEKIEETRYARMDDKQQKLYDAQVARMKQMLESADNADFNSSKLQILAELTRIRQICCDPSLLVENYKGESAKRTACLDLVKSAIAGEHKILIFSQFTSMLALLEQDLKTEKIPYFIITGATPKEKRLELVREFNSDSTPVFLISLKAGGTGLNLTGADIVIHYDPWWNVAAQNQATDRAHRIGQTKMVSVYKLIIKDTIEERILEMQEAKKNLAEEVLSGQSNGLSALTKEELLGLF